MNNAEKFKQIFGLYATELWSMPESDFLEWLNRDVETTQIDHTADIGKKVEGDCISRQAALDAIMGQPPEPHYPAWYAAQIEELPVVQPEHKTWRWMFGFDNRYLEKYYYCSNCGCRKYTEDEPSDYFCSKCGADMRGGDSE